MWKSFQTGGGSSCQLQVRPGKNSEWKPRPVELVRAPDLASSRALSQAGLCLTFQILSLGERSYLFPFSTRLVW